MPSVTFDFDADGIFPRDSSNDDVETTCGGLEFELELWLELWLEIGLWLELGLWLSPAPPSWNAMLLRGEFLEISEYLLRHGSMITSDLKSVV